MSRCICGLEGRHVGLILPVEDPAGEVLVRHHCDGPDHDATHVWDEPATDVKTLLAQALVVQGRARRMEAVA